MQESAKTVSELQWSITSNREKISWIDLRPGIYLMILNGKRYVGQSRILQRRVLEWAEYEPTAEFFVLEWCSIEELTAKEEFYISALNTLHPNGLNMAGSESARKKMSDIQKKLWSNPEHKARQIESAKRRWSSEEERVRMSQAHDGILHTEESKKKISESMKKYWENQRG